MEKGTRVVYCQLAEQKAKIHGKRCEGCQEFRNGGVIFRIDENGSIVECGIDHEVLSKPLVLRTVA